MHPISWLKTGDRWIPGIFVLGFAVMLAANGTMAWIAVGSFGGLATADYYDRGRTYNRTLATARDMAQTGWSAKLETSPQGQGRYRVAVHMSEADGQPLLGAQVSARFVRPSDADDDFEVVLQSQGQGLWLADIDPPADGLWQVRLFASRDDVVFATQERVVLQP